MKKKRMTKSVHVIPKDESKRQRSTEWTTLLFNKNTESPPYLNVNRPKKTKNKYVEDVSMEYSIGEKQFESAMAAGENSIEREMRQGLLNFEKDLYTNE